MPKKNMAKQIAKEKGEKHYQSDLPCPKGHIGARYVTSGGCVKCSDKQARAFAKNNKEKAALSLRKYTLRTKYGLTPNQLDELFEQQVNKCAICSCEMDRMKTHGQRSPHIDHCHKSGKVRGILCRECNIMLGMSADKIETLESAIEYLNNA